MAEFSQVIHLFFLSCAVPFAGELLLPYADAYHHDVGNTAGLERLPQHIYMCTLC